MCVKKRVLTMQEKLMIYLITHNWQRTSVIYPDSSEVFQRIWESRYIKMSLKKEMDENDIASAIDALSCLEHKKMDDLYGEIERIEECPTYIRL